MKDGTADPDPAPRLRELLGVERASLLDRWTRRLRGRAPISSDHVAALLDRLMERLDPRAPPQEAPCPVPPAPDDLPAALAEIGHLRAALADLCVDEDVPLAGETARRVHTAFDEAMVTVAEAVAREAAASRERERERFDLILRLLPVGVFVTDAGGRIVTINDTARRLWGRASFLGSVDDYGQYVAYRRGEREPIAASEWALARVLRGEEAADEDLEIVSASGERRTVVNSARALHDRAGRIAGGVAVNVDITDRTRTERRLAAILEGTLDAIVIIDEAGLITELNPAAERMFGYPRDEALGRELAELVIEPSLREAHRRGLRRYLSTGESRIIGRRVEMRALRADGTLFDVELSVIGLPTEGPPQFAGFVRDITDRRRAEEFRERFLGILSHDLRTPLAAITLSAGSLLERAGAGAEAHSLDRIVRNAGRMERMIRDLLDFTRARQGGGIPVTLQPGDLGAICRHVVDDVRLTHPDRAVELRSEGATAGRWDPDRVAQVVQNLLVNACDHSPSGAAVEVAVAGAGERVVVAVRNEGPPIPDEMRAGLFDPFRRGALPHEGGAREGLGLGLYIAREIVRAHQGSLLFESDATRGTVFRVELPRSPAEPPESATGSLRRAS